MSTELEHFAAPGDHLQFHHVQMYVNELRPISEYKQMEKAMNRLTELQRDQLFALSAESKANLTDSWKQFAPDLPDPRESSSTYSSAHQDIVEQLIIGAGWRVTGYAETADVRAVTVESNSAVCAKFIVSALRTERRDSVSAADKVQDERSGSTQRTSLPMETCWNFSEQVVQQFFDSHNGRQGVGILSFEITDAIGVETVFDNYRRKHPNLIARGPTTLVKDGDDVFKTLEVYAFYKAGSTKEPDLGTVIQFVEKRGPHCERTILPFFTPCPAVFDGISMPVFPDHWVSNVVNREQYLATLNDVLGFKPKVNFNAGVVAAGEAIIESTVTGNQPSTTLKHANDVLENQQQIYLPINNSLSEFGHVHFFIQEIGQGVQHIANRCADLVTFIQRANDVRHITGRGFAFLNIPRSYYGYLKVPDLVSATGLAAAECQQLFDDLVGGGLVDAHGIVDLDVDDAKLALVVNPELPHAAAAAKVVKDARYNHLIDLLGDRLTTDELLRIVRNQVLIDIQGRDVLYQIFTRCILQNRPNDEAPFLEFIQRVCFEDAGPAAGEETEAVEHTLKPGCGGFGIRNFLTLFLSIEVSKAMLLQETGLRENDSVKQSFGARMVNSLTEQLQTSNPILTSISDAMTKEDELSTKLQRLPEDSPIRATIEAEIDAQRSIKNEGNMHLRAVSEKYKNELRRLRSEYAKAQEARESLTLAAASSP